MSAVKRHVPFLLVMVVALGGALIGLGSTVPLDAHEAFVARSAEEMITRGDYLVPYLNDSPRLRKPPLNNWLVIGCDRLLDADGIVSEFEARLPSAMAGVMMVGCTIALGWLLIGRGTGLLAGLIVATSSGYVAYTHSARPEMVYAALCTLGLVCFALASPSNDRHTDVAPEHSRRAFPWWAWMGWIAMGLATLSKGPQLPLIMLIGWLMGSLWNKQFRSTLTQLHIPSGICIYALIAGWWFVVVWLKVPHAIEIWQLETIERYEIHGDSWWKILDPYYAYRPLGLILPWVVLYPAALLLAWAKSDETSNVGRSARLLSGVVFASMVLLSLSFGRRWYYMLPALPALALLMSAAAIEISKRVFQIRFKWGAAFFGLHIVGIAIVAAFLLAQHFIRLEHAWLLAACLALIAVAGLSLVTWSLTFNRTEWRAGVAIVAVGCFAIVAQWMQQSAGLFWSIDRFDRRNFAASIIDVAPRQQTLFGWDGEWSEQQYYLHRPIVRINDAKVVEQLAADQRPLLVLVDLENPPLILPVSLTKTILESGMCAQQPGRLQLWQIKPAAAVTAHK